MLASRTMSLNISNDWFSLGIQWVNKHLKMLGLIKRGSFWMLSFLPLRFDDWCRGSLHFCGFPFIPAQR